MSVCVFYWGVHCGECASWCKHVFGELLHVLLLLAAWEERRGEARSGEGRVQLHTFTVNNKACLMGNEAQRRSLPTQSGVV